jgi:hypothetical protein
MRRVGSLPIPLCWAEGRSSKNERGRFLTRAVRADAVLVVKQPSLSPERELNGFGIGQDFVIPDHAAVARQDIRGKVRVDLIRIGVLRQVPFAPR